MKNTFIICPNIPFLEDPHHYREQIYSTWKQGWGKEYQQVAESQGRQYLHTSDAFNRQNFAAGLIQDDRIVAIHFYSLYDLSKESSLDQGYIQNTITPEGIAALKAAGIKRFMSFEMILVIEELRKKFTSVTLVDLILNLGLKFYHSLPQLDGIVTLTRNNAGVHKLCKRCGFETLIPEMTFNDEPSSLMTYTLDSRPGQRAKTEKSIDESWQNRIELNSNFVSTEG